MEPEKKMEFVSDAHDLTLPPETPAKIIPPSGGKIKVLHPVQDRPSPPRWVKGSVEFGGAPDSD